MPKPTAKKPIKIPRSLGACADLLHDLREGRLTLQRQAEAIKPDEAAVREHIIATLPKGDTGASGQHHRAKVVNKTVFQVTDWEALYKHILKTKDFRFLNRALVESHVTAYVTEQEDRGVKKPKLPPGVGTFDVVTVSLEKI